MPLLYTVFAPSKSQHAWYWCCPHTPSVCSRVLTQGISLIWLPINIKCWLLIWALRKKQLKKPKTKHLRKHLPMFNPSPTTLFPTPNLTLPLGLLLSPCSSLLWGSRQGRMLISANNHFHLLLLASYSLPPCSLCLPAPAQATVPQRVPHPAWVCTPQGHPCSLVEVPPGPPSFMVPMLKVSHLQVTGTSRRFVYIDGTGHQNPRLGTHLPLAATALSLIKPDKHHHALL